MSRAERLTDAIAHHGEGAFWDAEQHRLLMVDVLAGDILAVDSAGVERRHMGDVAAVVRRRLRGGYVVALEREIVLTDEDWRIERSVPTHSSTEIRLNEGGCDPSGRFYCGSMAYDFREGAGTLFRLDADLSLSAALEDVTISNGIQWAADGRTAFYNDTATGRVDAFDVDDDGVLRERRTVATIEPPGAPDGMAIDTAGGLWIALWGGSGVVRLDERGRVSERVELPVPQVTSCAFGGPGRDILHITTSREGRTDDDAISGSVFVFDAGVMGAPVHPFAG